MLGLPLHPMMSSLPEPPLLRALTAELVDGACRLGVSVLDVSSYDHRSHMLAYVPGLGPRKAKELLKKLFFTGAVMLIMPGSPEQIIVAFLVGMVDLVMYSVFSPYPDSTDDHLAIASIRSADFWPGSIVDVAGAFGGVAGAARSRTHSCHFAPL